MRRKVICALLLAAAAPAFADSVKCNIIYGGENFTVSAQPTDDPYTVKAEKIGRYFEFKVSYVTAPRQFSALSIYVYGISTGDPVLIHQAKFPVDIANAPGPWGFTGFHYVYEPSKSSEIQYWCEKTAG
jgi:hypothetical protein